MPEVRNLTAKLVFMADYAELERGNQKMDQAKQKLSQLDDDIKETGRATQQMGEAFSESAKKTKTNTDALKDNTQAGKDNNRELTDAQKRVTDLSRQIELSAKTIKSQTAGLSDMGRTTKAARIQTEGLSGVLDLQKQKIQALHSRLSELKTAEGNNASAIHKTKVQILEETEAYGKLQGKMAKVSQTARHGRTTFVNAMDKAGSYGADYLMGVSAPITAGLVHSAKVAIDYKNQLNDIKSLLESDGESAKSATKVTNAMFAQGKQMASKYGNSVSEVGDAYEMMVRKGDTGRQAMAAIQKMEKASTAAGSDFLETTKTSMNVMEQFYGKAKTSAQTSANTTKVTNAMAYAADHGSAKFLELGYSMNYVGDYAKSVGYSLNDMAAYLEVMSRRGVEGTSAGTGLRGVMASLVHPSEKAAGAMKDLGIKTSDAHGNLLRLSAITEQLREKTSKMGTKERGNVISTIFGRTSLPTVTALMTESGKQLDAFSAKIKKAESQDYAGSVTGRMMKSQKNQLKQFKASLNSLEADLGAKVLPVVTPMIKGVKSLVDGFDHLSDGMKSAAVKAGIFLAAGVPLIVAAGKLYGYIIKIQDHLRMKDVYNNYANGMLEDAAATETFASAEKSAANPGSGGGIGSLSGRSSGKKGGLLSRLFRRGGAARGASEAVDVAEDAGGVVAKDSRFLRGIGTVGKFAGGGLAAVDIVSSLTGLFGKGSIGSKVGGVVGSLGGTWGGAAAGAGIGSFAGPIGTAIGGGIGAAIGSGVFSRLGKWAGGKLQSTFTGRKYTPTRPLEKGAASATAAYEKVQGAIDTKFKEMAASGSGYSKKMEKSINQAYDAIVTHAEKSAKAEESASKKNLNWFVKNGYISSKSAKNDLSMLKDSHHSAITSAKSAAGELKKINDKRHKADVASEHAEGKELASIRKIYSDKYGNISLTGQKYINRIERNYSADRTVIAAKYDKQREKLEGRLKTAVVGTISQSAIEQKIILGKLKNDSGKLSEQQASTIVKHARSARDGAISAADKKYKSVLDRADKERYGTGSMSKQQYDAVIKKARAQRDDAVSAANDQWHDTVSAAKSQAKGHAQWLDWETGKVKDAWYNKITYYVGKAWNWLQNLFSGKSSSTASMANWGYSTSGSSGSDTPSKASSATPKVNNPHVKKYAIGTTAGGHPGGDFVAGDNWQQEAIFTPDGEMRLSPAYPTLYKNMPAGTQVLSGDDTEKMMSAKAYAKGTGGFWSSVGDYLGKGFSWIKNGASSAAGWVMNKFGVGNVGNLGDLTQFTKNTAMPAVKKLLGSAISNLAHSSGAADMGDIKGVNLPGSAKSWIAKGMKLAGVSGADWAKGLAVIAQHESGGNANAVNRWDSNAKAGHPSAGLMQMIQSTFMANAVKGHTTWMNPIDQVAASIKYIERRYGSISRVPGIASMARGGKYVGYAKGTPGAATWAAKLFGGSKKKEDGQDKSSNLAVSQNKATSINPVFNITINVNGNDKGMSENKIARLVQEKVEAIFGDLRQTFDTGVEY